MADSDKSKKRRQYAVLPVTMESPPSKRRNDFIPEDMHEVVLDLDEPNEPRRRHHHRQRSEDEDSSGDTESAQMISRRAAPSPQSSKRVPRRSKVFASDDNDVCTDRTLCILMVLVMFIFMGALGYAFYTHSPEADVDKIQKQMESIESHST